MRVVVYPADEQGCGYHRLIWPAEELARQGHDVHVFKKDSPKTVKMIMQGQTVVDVQLPMEDIDVLVMQRVTHSYALQLISVLQDKGIAVVLDIDDDLTSIHPRNPAWTTLHPKNTGRMRGDGKINLHSWNNLTKAVRSATLITATTPELLSRYGVGGQVIPNYLADHYYKVVRDEGKYEIGWPASIHSHPDDPSVVGNAIDRLMREDGYWFISFGDERQTKEAFSLSELPYKRDQIQLMDWPRAMAEDMSVGIAPLADTVFNRCKSWLKPLEMCAVGIPWVGSPRADYIRLSGLGCGTLVDKPKIWYREIKKLLTNENHYVEQVERGLEVANQLSLRKNAWHYLEAWELAIKLQRDRIRA